MIEYDANSSSVTVKYPNTQPLDGDTSESKHEVSECVCVCERLRE